VRFVVDGRKRKRRMDLLAYDGWRGKGRKNSMVGGANFPR